MSKFCGILSKNFKIRFMCMSMCMYMYKYILILCMYVWMTSHVRQSTVVLLKIWSFLIFPPSIVLLATQLAFFCVGISDWLHRQINSTYIYTCIHMCLWVCWDNKVNVNDINNRFCGYSLYLLLFSWFINFILFCANASIAESTRKSIYVFVYLCLSHYILYTLTHQPICMYVYKYMYVYIMY